MTAAESSMSPAAARRRVDEAVSRLLERFEQSDYNPTPIIDLGVLVAQADGRIDEAEVVELRSLFTRMLGADLNAELVGFLIEASHQVIQAAGADQRIRLLAEILLDCDAVEDGLLVALTVAHAGDDFTSTERDVITRLARAAYYKEENLEPLVAIAREAAAMATDSYPAILVSSP